MVAKDPEAASMLLRGAEGEASIPPKTLKP